ncbi:hypothetical protein PILCRDRAFT_818081 [Piloderma croceum F 1598]|uniref:Uncharacterized protein n=1 Tax=Piloderma croceum (strain F 1598) TaxID=765440 RepID=A0A0C3FJA3_PILCF|nr:hypothetical protein PILCRDRAFT_818081 [Piloderma croceum F 1598]
MDYVSQQLLITLIHHVRVLCSHKLPRHEVLGATTRWTSVARSSRQNTVCSDPLSTAPGIELVNILITVLIVRRLWFLFIVFVSLAQKLRIHMLSMLSIQRRWPDRIDSRSCILPSMLENGGGQETFWYVWLRNVPKLQEFYG